MGQPGSSVDDDARAYFSVFIPGVMRSRDQRGLETTFLGFGLKVVGLGLGLGLMNNRYRVSYVLVSSFPSDKQLWI